MHTSPVARTFLQLNGPDAIRYLNGQVTHDVRLCTEKQSIHACVTDAKGKLQAVITIHCLTPHTLLIESELEVRDDLLARLDRYLIADDCEWTDRSDELQLMHTLGDESAEIVRAINRYGKPGFDLIATAQELQCYTSTASAPEDFEKLRIEHSLPVWGKELVRDMLPQEAGIEDSHISFSKGCYIGQEVISRIKSVGRVNRSLITLQLEKANSALTGKTLSHNGKDVGILTSISPTGRALGFRHRKAEGVKEFTIEGQTARVVG